MKKNIPHRKNKHAVNRVTGKEIADMLGISAMTVSRAINNRGYIHEETRQKVVAAAKKMGYSPNNIAKSLVLKKTHTIGVVIPEITHSFFPEAIRGIEEVTYRAHYDLILTHSAEDAKRERDAIRTLESKRVDGILISMAESVEDHKTYKELIAIGVPIVFFDRCVAGIGASCVSIDDELSAMKITEHLLAHGYKRVAHLSGPKDVSIGRARLNGFKRALAARGIVCHPELVIDSGFHESGGYAAMKKLLALPKAQQPRAVVAVNDPAAFGAMRAIQERGLRIPEDIAIAGFSDDIRAAMMPVPLTTVRQPAYEVGRLAALKLLGLIEGKSPAIEEIIVQTEQVIRKSCGCH
ncbi:MAG: LacI family DNA-binding transcriptional regulator [Ignavibacteriales bacterium]|nr:LacI family DNA-binding transcriptional regulator [Ignavibacteriales bacterium]